MSCIFGRNFGLDNWFDWLYSICFGGWFAWAFVRWTWNIWIVHLDRPFGRHDCFRWFRAWMSQYESYYESWAAVPESSESPSGSFPSASTSSSSLLSTPVSTLSLSSSLPPPSSLTSSVASSTSALSSTFFRFLAAVSSSSEHSFECSEEFDFIFGYHLG